MPDADGIEPHLRIFLQVVGTDETAVTQCAQMTAQRRRRAVECRRQLTGAQWPVRVQRDDRSPRRIGQHL